MAHKGMSNKAKTEYALQEFTGYRFEAKALIGLELLTGQLAKSSEAERQAVFNQYMTLIRGLLFLVHTSSF